MDKDVARQADRRVDALRAELARTTRALETVTSTVADLERRLAAAEQQLEAEAEARHLAEQTHLRELGSLRSEHAALSRRQAVQSGTPVAELDARDDELTALAATARRGADLLARRLPDGERTRLGALTEEWSAWGRTRLARRMRAVMLSRKLADGGVDDPDRRVDAEAFRAVVHELAGLDERRDATRDAAGDAGRRLAEDEQLRRDSDADVAAGQDADRRIRAVARERVGGAVARGELMPQWFETALPGRPVGEDPRWWQVASALVAYRILYDVDDPESALGPEPAGDWPPARRRARLGLEQAVASVGPGPHPGMPGHRSRLP